MERNTPINSVYLIALATCALITQIQGIYVAMLFAIISVAVFLFSISIVAMVERIADRHVRFLLFILIASAFIVLLKLLAKYINITLIQDFRQVIDFAILPCMMMAIVPIYFEESLTVKQFFIHSIIMSGAFLLMLTLYGLIVEMLGYGTIGGKVLSASFAGVEFFTMPYGNLLIIATLAIIFNMVRRLYLKKTLHFNMLVEKYKVIIRGIMQSEKLAKEQIEEGDKENE